MYDYVKRTKAYYNPFLSLKTNQRARFSTGNGNGFTTLKCLKKLPQWTYLYIGLGVFYHDFTTYPHIVTANNTNNYETNLRRKKNILTKDTNWILRN